MELINHSLELFHDNGCGGRIFKVTVVPGTSVMWHEKILEKYGG